LCDNKVSDILRCEEFYARKLEQRVWLVKLESEGYISVMVIESIREFNRAVPFKPYAIRMASGESYSVKHPDFVSVAPRGSFVIVFGKNDHPYHLSTLLIESVSLAMAIRRTKAGNGLRSRRVFLGRRQIIIQHF